MWCNETIVSLDLSSNNLDDHGGIYLARMLNKNSRLERLELDNNFLGPQVSSHSRMLSMRAILGGGARTSILHLCLN